MGLISSGNFTCEKTDKAIENMEGVHKSVDDVMCEDKGGGKVALVGKVEEVLQRFRKHGIIASAKKLGKGPKLEFGDFIVEGKEEGVIITPNPDRIRAVMAAREQMSRKEVECNLGQVRALAKWFPRLNVSTPNISANLTKGNNFL